MFASAVSSPVSRPRAPQPVWFWGFAVLLVLVPLPFGANRPWASDLFGLLNALLLLALAWDIRRNPLQEMKGAPVRRLLAASLCLTLVMVWAFLQTRSWMPTNWHHPLWRETRVDAQNFPGSIAIDPDRFAESALRLLSYISFFGMAFLAGRDAGRAKILLQFLVYAAFAYAFYGLLVYSSGSETILWYKKWTYLGYVTSTFVNKNSYATYAGLGLQACLVLVWSQMKRLPQSNKRGVWLENFGWFNLAHAVLALVVLGALITSGSRAGLFSGLAGCATLLLALAINRRWSWQRGLPLALGGIGFLIFLIFNSGTALVDRLNPQNVESDSAIRLAAYSIAQDAIDARAWLGYGLGSFESAFRLFSNETEPLWFQHAHNDFLEAVVELGLPAALLLLAAILFLLSCCLGGIRKRARQEYFSALALGATTTVGLHGLADFSLQIPAVAATYAALLGLGVAQSWSSRSKYD